MKFARRVPPLFDRLPKKPVQRKTTEKQAARGRLHELPSQLEGIHMARIHTFFEQLGLQQKECVLYDPQDRKTVDAINGIIAPFGNKQIGEGGEMGQYHADLDMVISGRHFDVEQYSGALYTEALLVHELAHGSVVDSMNVQQSFIDPLDGNEYKYIARNGFLVQGDRPKNAFFEEGFAEYIAGLYQSFAAAGREAQILAARGLPFTSFESQVINDGEYDWFISPKYIWKFEDGHHIQPTSYAAEIINQLCQRDHHLQQALVTSRLGSVDALRESWSRMHRLLPKTLRELRALPYQQDAFEYGHYIAAKELGINI